MMMREIRGGLGLFCVLGAVACSSEPLDRGAESNASGAGADANPGASAPAAPATPEPDDATAREAVGEVRERFQTPSVEAVRDRSTRAQRFEKQSISAIAPASGNVRFARNGKRLRALYDDTPATDRSPELSFAERANGSFSLKDRESGLEVEARLLGARDVAAKVADGFVIYEAATGAGGNVIHRVTDDGTEDYLVLEQRPESPEVRYEIRLSDSVAGLRLVANTLEMVDAGGAPRLRISPPYLVGADGGRTDATLEVEGCAVDRDPSEPWGRAVVAAGSSLCDVRVSWDDATVTYPALLDPSWATTANMSTARIDPVSTVLSTSRVIVAGGGTTALNGIASAELYNPSTRTWAATGSMATARWGHTGTLRNNGTFLVVGGTATQSGSYLASTESYNPTTGVWSAAASLANGHRGHSAVKLSNGDVLIAGSDSFTNMGAERLSVTTNVWSSAGAPGLTPWFTRMTLMNDGRVLQVGDNESGPQIYNPSSNSWSYAGALSKAQYSHATQTLLPNGQVLRAGGLGGQRAEVFDPLAGTFTRTGETSWPHEHATATSLGDGRVVIIGGTNSAAARSTETYNQTWGTWTQGPAMTTARGRHTAALMNNAKILVAGGRNGSGTALSSAEEYDPGVPQANVSEYKLAATTDAAVIGDRMTELWAAVWRPTVMPAGQRYPLILMLHGNHYTCGDHSVPRVDASSEYTSSGTCTGTYSVVVPNHRGYDYIAQDLASRGFIVVSINANRGINLASGPSDGSDPALILTRGRLILRHLQRLSEWNRNVSATPASLGFSLQNRLDLTQVGLLGHSRGGEGVRAAYERYRMAGSPWPAAIVSPVNFRAIFEIGPVDRYASTPQNADGTKWAVLLPSCDGDMTDLIGLQHFDRMLAKTTEANPTFKATYLVYGANHNYYNTEWQQADGNGSCVNHEQIFSSGPGITGSAEQRQTGFRAITSFFRANVGSAPETSFNNLFNPQATVSFGARVDRGYTPGLPAAQSKHLEDFTGAAGTSTFGLANTRSSTSVSWTHGTLFRHDPDYRLATIGFPGGGSPWFQTNFNNVGSGQNLSAYQLLDFRVDRTTASGWPLTMTVQLVNSNNVLSTAVSIANYVVVDGPHGNGFGNLNVMQTVRIPLSQFGGATLSSIRAVRFNFAGNSDATSVLLGSVRATVSTVVSGGGGTFLATADTGSVAAGPPPARPLVTTPPPVAKVFATGNRVVALRLTPDGQSVDVELEAGTPFPGRDAASQLEAGGRVVAKFGHQPGITGKRLTFRLSKADFDAIANGAALTVHYGSKLETWPFGALNKGLLTP